MSKEKSKLSYLSSLEISRNAVSEVDLNRKKYFVTFPYPYMNGKLHLGHLYSISKSDFMSYYKELQGYNVLFPFSFHCTGMPISASAKKLQEELDGKPTDISIKEIIQGLGFEDVRPFTDPIHWIKTFPKCAIYSLTSFEANVDWRRSFITTDLNPYYDSFVRWQFCKLKDLGYLSFGKRYSIFCPIDNQVCLDHDRRKGENVKPIQIILAKIKTKKGYLLVRYKENTVPCKVVGNKDMKLKSFKRNDTLYYIEESLFKNLRYQCSNIKEVDDVVLKDLITQDLIFDNEKLEFEEVKTDIFVLKNKKEAKDSFTEEKKEILLLENKNEGIFVETKNYVSLYIPEEEVISRSGGICVVSIVDQWYIDYDNEEWKLKAKKCLNNMKISDDTKDKLLEGVDWLNKWGFSRNFGLGTRIPWDGQYLVDSLSDSTIYQLFYTFKHYLFKDLEGKEEIFPKEFICNDVWDYILVESELPEKLKEYKNILDKCKESFNYYYPVDLRVSGKDLIKNHLLFFIFNHVALFEEKNWPKGIFTNGHLMLNSEKMSKSSGNFLTVDDAISKFGVSATRMCLAVCGDTNEDANFIESNANSFVLKLFSFVKNVEEIFEGRNKNENIEELLNSCQLKDMKLIDRYLLESISKLINLTISSYENMKYSDVVKYSFFEMTHLKETYLILRGNNNTLVMYLYKVMTQLLYPIIPSLSRYLLKEYFDNDLSIPFSTVTGEEGIESIDYLKSILKKITTHKNLKNNKNCNIHIGTKYVEWKQDIMKYIDSLSVPRNQEIKKDKKVINEILSHTNGILKKYAVSIKKGNLFVMDYLMNPDNYVSNVNEYKIITDYSFYLEENTGLKVDVYDEGRGEPLNPLFEFYN